MTSHRHRRYFTKTSFCRFAFCGISCLIWRNCVPTDLNHLNATVRWTVARWVGPQRHLNFCPFPAEEKCKPIWPILPKIPNATAFGIFMYYFFTIHSSRKPRAGFWRSNRQEVLSIALSKNRDIFVSRKE